MARKVARCLRFIVAVISEAVSIRQGNSGHVVGTAGTCGVQFWYLAVRQMIAILPPVLIALIAQRYIVGGLTLGAVKG